MNTFFKRIFDFIVSIILFVFLFPLFLLISLAIYINNPGPIFYRQSRVGRHGKVFQLLKFRSMVVNADKIGPYYTSKNDTRVTRMGQLLRKTSIDELPQIVNIIRGEMSFVGPRPDVLEQQPLYTPSEWEKRHTVLPGLTGLAQALKRSEATVEERKQLDLKYVDQQSFLLDMTILFKTCQQVFFKGSY
ncbi:MAG: sugar transferase [Proteobacteria bacterium]|nr:sugar transferase [Pseudomonadota bacterium]